MNDRECSPKPLPARVSAYVDKSVVGNREREKEREKARERKRESERERQS